MSFDIHYNLLKRFRHVALSAAAGLILALAMPRPGWWWMAWVGLIPLLAALRGLSARRAALCGFVCGAFYYGIVLRWIMLFGLLPWALLIVVESLGFGLFAAICARVAPWRIGRFGYLAVPAGWTALQFVRTLGSFGFIWGSLAHSQANCLPVAQIASITGPWGIDFIICFASLAIWSAIRTRSIKPLIAASLAAAGVVLFGAWSLTSSAMPGKSFKVAVLQGNLKNDFNPIPDYIPAALDKYSTMTRDAAKSRPIVILWPETALPTDLSEPWLADSLAKLARSTGSFLLVGGYASPDPATPGCIYNSLLGIDSHGLFAGSYSKVKLVPYGEFVPLRQYMPFLKRYGIRAEDLCAADDHALINTPIGKIGTSICFESTFPQIACAETYKGAELLCVVSNDAWFKRTSAPEQHFMMARLRAIENRRYLLRAAGTGISAVIDPYGRIRQQAGLFKTGTLIGEVVPIRKLSIYTLSGDWLAYISCFIVVLGLIRSACGLQKPAREKHPQEISH